MGNYPPYTAPSMDRRGYSAPVHVQVALGWVAGLSQAPCQLETRDQGSQLEIKTQKNLTVCYKRAKWLQINDSAR